MNSFLERFHHILTAAVTRLPDAITTLVLGLLVAEVILLISAKVMKVLGVKLGLRRVLKSLIRVFLMLVIFIAVIQSLGLNNVFVALTGSSVIVALLISTGAAPLITDVLAGLFLGGDREFQPGATVQAGDKGAEGIIETMGLRKTYIKDKRGTVHVVPNSVIEKNEWVILKKSPVSTKRTRRGRLKKSA